MLGSALSPLEESERVHALPRPLRFGILNPSHAPEIKYRRTKVEGMLMARHRQFEGEDLMRAWDTGGEIICFSVSAS